MHRIKLIHYTARIYILSALATLCFAGFGYFIFSNASATTSGKMVLYFHAEENDKNLAYNTLSLTPPESTVDSSAGTTSTVTSANPATTFCNSGNFSSSSVTVQGASAASVGNMCMATFISSTVGQVISMSTSDAANITGQFWSSETANNVTAALNVYIYRWSGTGTTVLSSDRIATLTCADPSTSATSCTPAAVSPANNITFAASDRIVAIMTMNVTGVRSGAGVQTYFDNYSRTPTQITMKYTMISANKPTLTGSLDDDFSTAAATTPCSTSGVAYNTKWTCLQGSAGGTSGSFNAEDTTAAGSGDSSDWLWLKNTTTATTATVSNFGTTPSNTFLYQAMPSSYGSGNIRTVVNTSMSFGLGGYPLPGGSIGYNHVGLVLWASNTDYFELQLYNQSSTNGVSTTNAMWAQFNNSGTGGSIAILDPTTNAGNFNKVWLGFSFNGNSWQPQYSVDGSTWNNIGSPISHSTFSRTGLNAYTAFANPVSSYAGAFEWFQSTLAAPTYSQMSYQWFANADSTVPGSPFGTMNTPYTLTSTGQQFRLRYLLKETGQTATSGDNFKLQYAALGGAGSCSSIVNGSWSDVTTPATSWTQGTAAAGWPARDSFATVIYNNKIWVMGGIGNGAPATYYNDVWSSSDGVNWTQATANAGWVARYGFKAVVLNSKMYIMGGSNSSGGTLHDVWSSTDGVTWTQETAAAGWSTRLWFNATVFNSKMWIAGGELNASTLYNDVWSSPDGVTWTQTTANASWSQRLGEGLISYNGKLYVMGGQASGAAEQNDVWSSTDGATWSQVTAAAGWGQRDSFGAEVFNNKIYVMGGFNGANYNNDVWYSSDGASWTRDTASAPWSTRYQFGTGVLGSNLWIFGGYGGTSLIDNHETWYATGSSGSGILFYDNVTPASGANISTTANDPTDAGQTVNPQTYQESNTFTNAQSAIGNTIDGEWDFSLYDYNAPAGTTYCFRVAKSDGTALTTYTNYPQITTYSPGPTMDQVMRGGAWFSSGGVKQDKYWAH